MRKTTALLLSFLTFSGCGKNDSNELCGVYQGLLPAADADGLSLTIELKKDKTFQNKLVYIDENESTFVENGAYNIAEDIVELKTDDEISYYKIEDNSLKLLDYQKKEIEGELADMYILQKIGGCD